MELTHATVKSVKADLAKSIVALTFELDLGPHIMARRFELGDWLEADIPVDLTIERSYGGQMPLPLAPEQPQLTAVTGDLTYQDLINELQESLIYGSFPDPVNADDVSSILRRLLPVLETAVCCDPDQITWDPEMVALDLSRARKLALDGNGADHD